MIVLSYIFLVLYVGFVAYLVNTIGTVAAVSLPWLCKNGVCQRFLTVNLAVLACVFILNLITAVMTTFAIIALFLNIERADRKKGIIEYVAASFRYKTKVFALALIYSLIIFFSFLYLAGGIPSYIPAPVPIFFAYLILEKNKELRRIADYKRSFFRLGILKKILVGLVRLAILTTLPFIYYSLNGISLVINVSTVTMGSFILSLGSNIIPILQQGIIAIIVFTVTGTYYLVHKLQER